MMNILKKGICAMMIFLSGGMTFINLSYIKFGSPFPHGKGSWIKVVIHCMVSIYFTALLIRIGKNRNTQ